MAGNKSTIKLDIPAMCELAVASKGFAEEIGGLLDELKAAVNELHGDSIDGLSGGQGEEINAALDELMGMSEEIKELCTKINVIASSKAEKMNEQYKDHGGADQLAKAQAAHAAIKRT